MPRSTRHKSSKHKDARDHSDSEKEERKSSSAIRVSSEKRKEYYDNGEYYEEHTSSSKRRRGKTGESSKDDEKGESSSKKAKVSSEKSSRRREEGDGDEMRKSSSGKHRESSRRESKEVDKDKDKKYKESKSEKLYDGDDHHRSKGLSDKTESKADDQLKSLGTENHTEKRSRRKRDDHGSGDKHQDNSDDDYIKDGKHRGEKSRDKYLEDKEEDVKQTGEKQREDRPTKEHHRSDGKLLPEESKRKSKLQDTDHGHEPDSELDGYHERERDRERARDRDRDYERDRDRDRERDRDRRDYEHDRYYGRDWDRDRSRDRDRDHDRDRTHEREKDRSSRDYYHDGKRSKSDRERDNDRDLSRLDDQSGRYKDRREGRKSPDYQEVVMDTRSSRPDGDVIKSDRQPSSSVVQEENGNVSDQTTKWVSSREAAELSGGSDRGTRQKVSEKTAKTEDGVLGEYHGSTKASPRPMVERSPSSTSLDRRFNNQSSARWSLEGEETGLRNNNARDFSAPEDERLRVDDTSQGDISFNNKSNQNNSSFPPRPESRSGISSPRVGLREDDNRVNTGGRYRRGVDTMMGRGQTQGNVWRGSWPAPLPNGFIPFQHVQPHGFQTMMPQYPSPSIFGVRPSMEMNHTGLPYHIPDAERFSGHMRPLGWQNMMDNSGASSHMHGFFGDMSNSAFRDESNMYGGSEWDHNRRMHSRGWESVADEWKNRNGDASMEVSSRSGKDDNSAQVADGESPGGQTSHSENNRGKSVEAGSNLTSPAKEVDVRSPKIKVEVAAEDPVAESIDKSERICRHYLSKLDLSIELADPELRKCISLLMDEEHQPIDDGAAVFVNLKEGGKRVPKGNSTSLATLSLFPTQNSSLFQIAMDLYKEQRFEMKGLLNVEIHRPPQASPSRLLKVDVSDPDTSQKEDQKVSLPVDAGLEMGTQVESSSSPILDKSPEALVPVASDHNESYEEDAKPDDGAAVEQTMDTAPEGDAVTEGDPVTETIASPEAPEAMEVDEGKVLCEDKNMEEAGEKEVEADDGNGNGDGGIVGDVSPKVKETLVNESDESVVISQIHDDDATQSTH